MVVVWIWQGLSGTLGPGAAGHDVTLNLPASIYDDDAVPDEHGAANNSFCANAIDHPEYGVESFTGNQFSSANLYVEIRDDVHGWLRMATFRDLNVLHQGHTSYDVSPPGGGHTLFISQPVSFRIHNTDTITRSWTNLSFHLSDVCWYSRTTPVPDQQGYAATSLIVLDGAGSASESQALSRGRSRGQVVG